MVKTVSTKKLRNDTPCPGFQGLAPMAGAPTSPPWSPCWHQLRNLKSSGSNLRVHSHSSVVSLPIPHKEAQFLVMAAVFINVVSNLSWTWPFLSEQSLWLVFARLFSGIWVLFCIPVGVLPSSRMANYLPSLLEFPAPHWGPHLTGKLGPSISGLRLTFSKTLSLTNSQLVSSEAPYLTDLTLGVPIFAFGCPDQFLQKFC